MEKREFYPQSSAQNRLFFLDQFEHIGTSYNIPKFLRVRGAFDQKRFEEVFKALVFRHESLRTSFALIGHDPIQRIHDDIDFIIEKFEFPTEPKGAETGVEIEKRMEEVVKNFVCPFDLSKAPLVRVGLLEIGEKDYLLLFDIHHIVGDGTSTTILTNEFVRLYSGEELTPIRIQYKDFALWQNHLFETGEIKKQEKYWLDLYGYSETDTGKAEIPLLNLPTDYPRPATFQFKGETYSFVLESGDTLIFKELCTETGTTLFMNLLAAFNVLLYKYSGQDDIIVGSGIMGRPHADLLDIIGMFVNSLPIRSRPVGEKTYLEFLQEVKENTIKAFENQDVQFEYLVDLLKVERNPSRNPLFDVLFVVQNFEKPKGKMKEGISFLPFGSKNTITKFDLTLFAFENERDNLIYFALEYATSLFKHSTAVEIAEHYIEIIRQVIENREMKLKEIKISHEVLIPESAEFLDIHKEFGF